MSRVAAISGQDIQYFPELNINSATAWTRAQDVFIKPQGDNGDGLGMINASLQPRPRSGGEDEKRNRSFGMIKDAECRGYIWIHS